MPSKSKATKTTKTSVSKKTKAKKTKVSKKTKVEKKLSATVPVTPVVEAVVEAVVVPVSTEAVTDASTESSGAEVEVLFKELVSHSEDMFKAHNSLSSNLKKVMSNLPSLVKSNLKV